jgi:hypothetical protein
MATRHLELTYPIKLWVLRHLDAAGDAWPFDCCSARSALAVLTRRLYALLFVRL